MTNNKDLIALFINNDECFHGKAVSEEVIKRTESEMGIRFAPDYREYVKNFGVVSFGIHELTGICPSQRLNVKDVTEKARLIFTEIPLDWYVLEDTTIDNVLIWQSRDGSVYQAQPNATPVRIAKNIYEFIEMK